MTLPKSKGLTSVWFILGGIVYNPRAVEGLVMSLSKGQFHQEWELAKVMALTVQLGDSSNPDQTDQNVKNSILLLNYWWNKISALRNKV